MKVNNAIILAAGSSSRFLPLTIDKPKALLEVKGEILIERLIKQLQAVGINEIIVVGGYQFESLRYLEKRFNVILIENKEYLTRNNHSSLYAVRNYLKNSYICSSDNYYLENVFHIEEKDSYYSAIYTDTYTNEWIINCDDKQLIESVTIGGTGYYMLGHAYFSADFSRKLINFIEHDYEKETIKSKFWEDIYLENIKDLKMYMRDFTGKIMEFDNLDELRLFDDSYLSDSRSLILKQLAQKHQCDEQAIHNITPIKAEIGFIGIKYQVASECFEYYFSNLVK